MSEDAEIMLPTRDDAPPYRPYRKLGADDLKELRTLYEAGESMSKLAEKFECHRQTIARQLKKVGVDVRVQQVRSPEFDTRAAVLYGQGKSLDDVAKLLNVQASTIARALRSQGVTLRPAVADRWHGSPPR